MRTFYIFKINNEFKTFTKKRPYNLFLALNDIHNMDKENVKIALSLFKEICTVNEPKSLNFKIFNALRNSDYYTKFNSNHLINNYYTRENSKLIIHKSYMKIKTTTDESSFFNILKSIPNLFVIDFEEKDYFWLS